MLYLSSIESTHDCQIGTYFTFGGGGHSCGGQGPGVCTRLVRDIIFPIGRAYLSFFCGDGFYDFCAACIQ